MRPYRFEPEAEEELRDAAAWYEAERVGLGNAFLMRIREATEFARRFPNAGAPVLTAAPELSL